MESKPDLANSQDTTFYIFTDLRSYISRGIIQVIFTTTPDSHKVKGIIRNDIDTKFLASLTNAIKSCKSPLDYGWYKDLRVDKRETSNLFLLREFLVRRRGKLSLEDLYIPIMATCKLRHIFLICW